MKKRIYSKHPLCENGENFKLHKRKNISGENEAIKR